MKKKLNCGLIRFCQKKKKAILINKYHFHKHKLFANYLLRKTNSSIKIISRNTISLNLTEHLMQYK